MGVRTTHRTRNLRKFLSNFAVIIAKFCDHKIAEICDTFLLSEMCYTIVFRCLYSDFIWFRSYRPQEVCSGDAGDNLIDRAVLKILNFQKSLLFMVSLSDIFWDCMMLHLCVKTGVYKSFKRPENCFKNCMFCN